MGTLRAIFSRAGLCDSDADLALKPDLVSRIVDWSIARTAPDAMSGESYRARLSELLLRAKKPTLDHLMEERVVVCLDARLAAMKPTFMRPVPPALYYNGPQKILSLRDTGLSLQEGGFLNRTALSDHVATLNALRYIPNDLAGKPVLGRGLASNGQVTYPIWTDRGAMESAFRQNVGLRNPPLRARSADGPPLKPA